MFNVSPVCYPDWLFKFLKPIVRPYNPCVPKIQNAPRGLFCSQESLEAGEPLAGTAPRADIWFLLEYPGRWGNKALKESSIPEDVKAYLNAQLNVIPESRLLLIKQSRTTHTHITFFAALPKKAPSTLYRFFLTKYEELLDIDLVALAAGDARFDSAIVAEPLFVTCTNGLRDQCCALNGVATYLALAAKFPGRVWESTHHGGHRFAANFLHLPNAISYGRLRPETAPAILESALEGHLSLDNMRGRTIYAEPIQAAEVFLRQQMALNNLDGLQFRNATETQPSQWKVTFEHAGKLMDVSVLKEVGEKRIHISCGDQETSPMVTYRPISVITA